MASLTIPITKLRDDAVVPSYAYPGDAGVDLRAVEPVSLAPFERALVPTGLAIAIPEGYAGFVQPRSGLAIKQGITVLNAPGLIDSHYRGELKVALIKLDAHSTFEVAAGARLWSFFLSGISHGANGRNVRYFYCARNFLAMRNIHETRATYANLIRRGDALSVPRPWPTRISIA